MRFINQLLSSWRNMKMKYKITVIGPAGSGKTTLIELVWKKRQFEDIKTTPTTNFAFIDQPIKLGNIRVNALDLGGQQLLLDKWLDKDGPFKCFKDCKGVLIVLDFTKHYLSWVAGHKNQMLEEIDRMKGFISEVITTIRLQNPPNSNEKNSEIKLSLCFNKWDLILDKEFYSFLNDEFNKFFKSKLISMNGCVNYRGNYPTSSKNELYSPKIVVRAVMPHSVAIKQIFENFIRRYLDHDAERVYFSTLNEDFLEIETHQHPKDHDFQPVVLALLKSMYHSYHVDETFKSLLFKQDGNEMFLKTAMNEIILNGRSHTAQLVPLNKEISLFVLSDVEDTYLFKKLSDKLQDALIIKDGIYS